MMRWEQTPTNTHSHLLSLTSVTAPVSANRLAASPRLRPLAREFRLAVHLHAEGISARTLAAENPAEFGTDAVFRCVQILNSDYIFNRVN